MAPREEPQASIDPEKLFATAGLPMDVNLKYYEWLQICRTEYEEHIPAFLHFLQRYFNKQTKEVLPEHQALQNDHRWAIWKVIRSPLESWKRSSEGRSILPSVLTADQMDFEKLFQAFAAAEGIAMKPLPPIPEQLTHDQTVVVATFHDNPDPQLVQLAVGIGYGKSLKFILSDGRAFVVYGKVTSVEKTAMDNMWDVVINNEGRLVKVQIAVASKTLAEMFLKKL